MAETIGIHKGVRVLNVPLILVEFTDKEGAKQIKLAVITGDQVRLLADEITRPAQDWLTENILKAAGVRD